MNMGCASSKLLARWTCPTSAMDSYSLLFNLYLNNAHQTLHLCNYYWYIIHITSFFIMYICIYNDILVSKSWRCIAMGETSPATHTPTHWTFMWKWAVDIRYQTDDGDRQELLQLWDKSGRPKKHTFNFLCTLQKFNQSDISSSCNFFPITCSPKINMSMYVVPYV